MVGPRLANRNHVASSEDVIRALHQALLASDIAAGTVRAAALYGLFPHSTLVRASVHQQNDGKER